MGGGEGEEAILLPGGGDWAPDISSVCFLLIGYDPGNHPPGVWLSVIIVSLINIIIRLSTINMITTLVHWCRPSWGSLVVRAEELQWWLRVSEAVPMSESDFSPALWDCKDFSQTLFFKPQLCTSLQIPQSGDIPCLLCLTGTPPHGYLLYKQ